MWVIPGCTLHYDYIQIHCIIKACGAVGYTDDTRGTVQYIYMYSTSGTGPSDVAEALL